MLSEIEEVLSKGKESAEEEREKQRSEEPYFDSKVFLAAKEIIRYEEGNLFKLIKKHFEQNRQRRVEVESIKGYKSGIIRSFQEKIEISDFVVKLNFNNTTGADESWSYTISCEELKIKDLYPPQNNELAIQGQFEISFFCKTSGETKKQTIIMMSYS